MSKFEKLYKQICYARTLRGLNNLFGALILLLFFFRRTEKAYFYHKDRAEIETEPWLPDRLFIFSDPYNQLQDISFSILLRHSA